MTGALGGAGALARDGELLVGRGPERAVLRVALDQAMRGEPQLVLIEGVGGVGKSALVRDLAASMPSGHVALWARGEEIERQLDFGVIDQLLREAGAAGLSAPPALLRSGQRPDPLDVGQIILDLAEEYGADRPLLVVVDDAQWADVASIQAMSFAYRRLHQRAVLCVMTHRPDAAQLEPFQRLARDGQGHRLRMGPLSVDAVAELVRTRTGVKLTPRAAGRLHEHTQGNPLETLTLVDELDPMELTSGFGPLPAPRSYASLVLGRLASCSPTAEQLVALVAVAGVALELGVLSRMCELDHGGDALAEAVRRDLLSVARRSGRKVVEVAHPLIRAAVVADLPPSRTAELHALVAGAIDDPDLSFVHRLRSVVGEDADLAAEAIDRANAQLADGWALRGVELLVTASGLLPAGPARTDARLRAARWLLRAGEPTAAHELLEGLEESDQPLEDLVRGELALLEGDDAEARRLLSRAWEAEPAPDVAARTAGLLATAAATRGRTDDAMNWARLALEQGCRAPSDVGYAVSMLASGWALAGDLYAARAEINEWATRLCGGATRSDVRYARGVVALWTGCLEEAVELLRVVAEDGTRDDPALIVASAGYSLADAWYRIGNWDEAQSTVEQLARHLENSGQMLAAPMAHGIAASVLAARGQLDAARDHLHSGRAAMDATRNRSALLWLATAKARIAATEADHEGVVTALSPLADALRPTGLPEGVQPWRADLIDALVALGRLDEAAVEMEELDRRTACGGAHVRAGAARARGNLAAATGDAGLAAEAFAAGLEEDPVACGVYGRARLELAAGAFERRRGQRRAAAALLDSAVVGLESLGAAPLLERARQERAGCGLSPSRVGGGELTKSERSVAALVAAGHSNREVARRLVVSVKTVETHLAHVFDKLGVRSRTELANLWHTVADEGQATP